jgi:nitroreductase
LQAPTGSNQQNWHWVVVEDDAKKLAIADIYRLNFAEYRKMAKPTYAEGDTRRERADLVQDSAQYLADNFHRAPLLLVPCLWGRVDGGTSAQSAGFWGSLLPAVWSFMLALREHGLGSAWTTLHLPNGGDAKVAEILGIPHDKVAQAGLFPIAYTLGTDFQRAKRQPVADVLHWGQW